MALAPKKTRRLRVAVITPYYKPNLDWLRKCHESLLAQTYPCTQIFVGDGIREPAVGKLKAQHIVLGANHADYGDTPRAIGSLSAIGQGFDAIAYLDADNWYYPRHIESLVTLHRQTGAVICISHRYLHRVDGSRLGLCHETDGNHFADTSSMFLTRPAFRITANWALMDPKLHPIGDRIVMHRIRESKLKRAFSNQPTLAYRTTFPDAYERFGEKPPPEAKDIKAIIEAAYDHFISRGGPDLRPKVQQKRPRLGNRQRGQ